MTTPAGVLILAHDCGHVIGVDASQAGQRLHVLRNALKCPSDWIIRPAAVPDAVDGLLVPPCPGCLEAGGTGPHIRRSSREIRFGGRCPYLMCLLVVPHAHPVCPSCGAVRYGNPSCRKCLRLRAAAPINPHRILGGSP